MATHSAENKLGILNIVVIFLSIYILGALIIDTAYELPPETSTLLQYFDNAICGVFFIEFCFFNRQVKELQMARGIRHPSTVLRQCVGCRGHNNRAVYFTGGFLFYPEKLFSATGAEP